MPLHDATADAIGTAIGKSAMSGVAVRDRTKVNACSFAERRLEREESVCIDEVKVNEGELVTLHVFFDKLSMMIPLHSLGELNKNTYECVSVNDQIMLCIREEIIFGNFYERGPS